jgi:hypothetical protein
VEPAYARSAVGDKDGYPLNVDGHGNSIFSMIDDSGLLPESSSLTGGLSEDALADIVKDYSSAVKKFDFEDATVEADSLASTGSLSTWFDCIKDSFDSATDSVPTKSALLETKLSPQDTSADTPQDVSNAGEKAPKSRKARKSAAKEQGHAQHDSEMDHGAPVLIGEKRKRRCVFVFVPPGSLNLFLV